MSVPLHTRSLDLKLTRFSVSYFLVTLLEFILSTLELIYFVLNLYYFDSTFILSVHTYRECKLMTRILASCWCRVEEGSC